MKKKGGERSIQCHNDERVEKIPRVYFKHSAYYYVTLPERKWIHLGTSESEMYAALSKIKALDVEKGTMLEYIHRYEKEVIPQKSPRTQIDNLAEIKNIKKAFGHFICFQIL